MLLVKVECKNINVEKLAECLAQIVEPFFRVWLYDKKVYAIFKVSSMSILKQLIDKLNAVRHLKFKFYRIEEV